MAVMTIFALFTTASRLILMPCRRLLRSAREQRSTEVAGLTFTVTPRGTAGMQSAALGKSDYVHTMPRQLDGVKELPFS